jgi:transketolase
LGADEVAATRAALGIPSDFYVAPEATAYFTAKRPVWKQAREAWQAEFAAWSAEHPDKRAEWDFFYAGKAAPVTLPVFAAGEKLATRTAGNKALGAVAAANANLVGGAADLKGPNAVGFAAGAYSAADRSGRYIHFGIREFGMAAIANGIQLHGGLRAFCATFMVFADYLRPAMRLAALMKQPVIYVLTHDSIFVGEDGPTHQPIEHLASFRIIPGLNTFRPADPEEAAEAWAMAMERADGPTVLALSRQNLAVFAKDDPDWRHTIRAGAYIVKKAAAAKPDVVVLATGSEVGLALEAAAKAAATGKQVRVVSVISRELFEAQPAAIQQAIVPAGVRVVTCEAGVRTGWERWAKPEDVFSIDRFGESGPAAQVAEALGFTADALAALLTRA